MKTKADFVVCDYGSIVSFLPVSAAARKWFAKHVQAESWQWRGSRLMVDLGPAQNLVQRIEYEGFIITIA